jgi:hypothetical protein
MLFIQKTTADGPIPSVSTPLRVLGPIGSCAG